MPGEHTAARQTSIFLVRREATDPAKNASLEILGQNPPHPPPPPLVSLAPTAACRAPSRRTDPRLVTANPVHTHVRVSHGSGMPTLSRERTPSDGVHALLGCARVAPGSLHIKGMDGSWETPPPGVEGPVGPEGTPRTSLVRVELPSRQGSRASRHRRVKAGHRLTRGRARRRAIPHGSTPSPGARLVGTPAVPRRTRGRIPGAARRRGPRLCALARDAMPAAPKHRG